MIRAVQRSAAAVEIGNVDLVHSEAIDGPSRHYLAAFTTMNAQAEFQATRNVTNLLYPNPAIWHGKYSLDRIFAEASLCFRGLAGPRTGQEYQFRAFSSGRLTTKRWRLSRLRRLRQISGRVNKRRLRRRSKRVLPSPS
jgi:hypothetical protein